MASKHTKHLFGTAVLLMIITFIVGIFLGFNLNTKQEHDVQQIIRNTELTTESYLIEQELIGITTEQTCELTNKRISELSDEIDDIGTRLNAPGAESNLGSKNFNFLKRKYYLLQIKAYLFFNRFLNTCDKTTNILLYYYSPDSEIDIGPMLTEIAQDQNVRIFPIEYNYSKEIRFIEGYYDIQTTPSVIVNYEDKLEGRFTKEDILTLMS